MSTSGIWQEWQTKSLREVIAGRAIRWWESLNTPDPWPEDMDVAVREDDALPVCHHCATPFEDQGWFCPSCGAAVGPYNNVMPYIRIFSQGEALRSGVGPEAHFTPYRAVAYMAIGLAEFGLFAPVYYFRLYRNYRRLQKQDEQPAPEGS